LPSSMISFDLSKITIELYSLVVFLSIISRDFIIISSGFIF